MKKQLLLGIVLLGALLMPQTMKAQSTEGKDFWVTFMQADQWTSKDAPLSYNGKKYNPIELSLSISSREDCDVTIRNPYYDYSETVHVTANQMKLVEIFSGLPLRQQARQEMETTGKVCYAVNSEKVDSCALHVTATKDIALFATNYKKATFDATNVLPTPSLLDEYMIQTYSPSDHDNNPQGSHFVIIATEDNTVVEYILSANTTNNTKGDTVRTPALKAGQVWYVWTDEGRGDNYDLSGTKVTALDGKKIAVFQGCPHTNIPDKVKQRDHIFSQAMPTQYWGNTFVLTASRERPSDIIRIMAIHDGTEVKINGDSVYTFDFKNTDKKQYWEFEIGQYGDYAKNGSCLVTTSCPCAVHLFLTSQEYHVKKDGDPGMVWINPIEQQIDQITFATYNSSNGTSHHFVNVVTDKPQLMTIDGISATDSFTIVDGSTEYYYAQMQLGTQAKSHTLKSNGSNFIAHVYGFTANESYGYSAGGATRPLHSVITINDDTLAVGKTTQICRKQKDSREILFTCKPDGEYIAITWNFGDGKMVSGHGDTIETRPHTYSDDQLYKGYVLIDHPTSQLCGTNQMRDSFPMEVVLDALHLTYEPITDNICSSNDAFRIYYNANRDLTAGNMKVQYSDPMAFKTAPQMKTDDNGKTYFNVEIPSGVKDGSKYSIQIEMGTKCDTVKEEIPFSISYAAQNVLARLWENTIAVWTPEEMKALIKKKDPSANIGDITFDSYKWYKRDTTETREYTLIENEHESFLLKDRLAKEDIENNVYYVDILYTEKKADGTTKQNTLTSCPIGFNEQAVEAAFNADSLINGVGGITFNRIDHKNILVMTAQDATASWINTSGSTVMSKEIRAGGGMMALPEENGLYILKVEAGKNTKSMKIMIQ